MVVAVVGVALQQPLLVVVAVEEVRVVQGLQELLLPVLEVTLVVVH